MHSALLVIEKLPQDADMRSSSAWAASMAAIRETLKTADQVEVLSENVLLLTLRSDLSTLALLIETCLSRHLSYKVLFLNEAPEWVLSPNQFHSKP